jgi:Lrp/AsnC family leucine-responsive transcriptional regulator
MTDIDPTDRRLLALLQENGRLSNAELGQAVGLSISAVNERSRKLVERGLITGFHAHASPEALGLDLLAFVFVGWSDPAVETQFLTTIGAAPNILECHHVTGAWNYLMKVRVRNTRMLEAFLGHVVKAVPGVLRTETLIVLSSPKETAVLPTVG